MWEFFFIPLFARYSGEIRLTDNLGMAMTVLGRLSASQSVLHRKMCESYPPHPPHLSGLFFHRAALKVILIIAHIYAVSHSTSTSHRPGTTKACLSFLSMRKAYSATVAMQTLAL